MTRLALVSLPVAALLLAACDPGDPNLKAKRGAAIGAAVGGAIGAGSSDKDLEKTVIGAAVGAVVGGAIGDSLDKQERDLRRDLNNDAIGVINTGTELRVTMPQDLLFATDSDALRPDLQADLRVLANNLNEYPNSRVIVVGHTDSTGTQAYNLNLSERRARTVAGILQSSGVSGGRLSVIGQGEAQPIASNATASGRAQNRRVEIVIRPNA